MIEKKNNQPKDGDPRIGFINQLIKDCGMKGDILTYNVSFERSRLIELVRDYPKYSSQLQPIIERLKDLMTPFKEYWYYSPAMKGSYSIKYVLPALMLELSYKDLEIQEGGTVSAVYAEMAAGYFKGDVEKSRKALFDYCHLDTLAMVSIGDRLNNIK